MSTVVTISGCDDDGLAERKNAVGARALAVIEPQVLTDIFRVEDLNASSEPLSRMRHRAFNAVDGRYELELCPCSLGI